MFWSVHARLEVARIDELSSGEFATQVREEAGTARDYQIKWKKGLLISEACAWRCCNTVQDSKV